MFSRATESIELKSKLLLRPNNLKDLTLLFWSIESILCLIQFEESHKALIDAGQPPRNVDKHIEVNSICRSVCLYVCDSHDGSSRASHSISSYLDVCVAGKFLLSPKMEIITAVQSKGEHEQGIACKNPELYTMNIIFIP